MHRSGKTSTIVIILVLLVGTLTVAGCGGFLFVGFQAIGRQGGVAIRNNPVVQEHIGTITDCEMEFWASMMHERDDTFIFDVQGTQGSGVVKAHLLTIDDETEEIVGGTLELDTGETFDLLPKELLVE